MMAKPRGGVNRPLRNRQSRKKAGVPMARDARKCLPSPAVNYCTFRVRVVVRTVAPEVAVTVTE